MRRKTVWNGERGEGRGGEGREREGGREAGTAGGDVGRRMEKGSRTNELFVWISTITSGYSAL